MSKHYQVETLRVETDLLRYKTVAEKKAFLEGYTSCLKSEKEKIKEERKEFEKRWKEKFND